MKKELQKAVFDAFDDVLYPGDGNIGDPSGRDDAEEVEKVFRGLDWRSLAFKKLSGIALLFMTPEALHYYIPAYLISAIEEVGADEVSGLCFCLSPEKSAHNLVDGGQKTSKIDSLFTPNWV